MDKQVINIDLYQKSNLPKPLIQIASDNNIVLEEGLIAVKTFLSESNLPDYEFISLGKSRDKFEQFLENIAKEDGINLNEALKEAYNYQEE